MFKRLRNKIQLQTILIVILDMLAFNMAYFGAIWLRHDFRYGTIPTKLLQELLFYAPYFTLFTIILFALFKLYRSMWEYVGTIEVLSIIFAGIIDIIVQRIVFTLLSKGRFPFAFYIIEFFLLIAFTMLIRFFYRFYKYFEREHFRVQAGDRVIPTMIVGAGEAGRTIVHELRTTDRINNEVVCIVDDNPNKWGKRLEGIEILGDRYDIPKLVRKFGIKEIILAVPSMANSDRKEILDISKETGAALRTLPGIYQLISGEVSVSKLRDVDLVDLLGRDPIAVNTGEILQDIEGKRVLVTGGGGTIGSELCRQIAANRPKKLILFDIYENNTYSIQLELERNFPDVDLAVLIGSVRDKGRLEEVFSTYRPQIVYHAAAHKHVPLMEDSPHEAVKNNVFGTLNTAQCADVFGCKRFVLISTDKAVNPTNVMGATKRICEMVIQMMNRKSKTDFVAVRFGNVLGSSGSVVPIFKKQIERGGPVTVTHPEIERFFMTIPEAVSLVLQAGFYAKGGEIFILDMGEPVKIVDMAKNLIKLSGYKPDEEIAIVFTGLRPGEKLYEEVLMDEEGLQKTANSRIRIGKPIELDDEKFVQQLNALYDRAYDESYDIRYSIAQIVPTFKKSVDGIPHDYFEKESTEK